MASEVTKISVGTENIQATVLTWKRANDAARTMARLSAKSNEVVLRANGTAYIFSGENAAKVFLPILESEDVDKLFVTPQERKAYGANLYIVRSVLGMTTERPRTSSGGGVTVTGGKSEVAKIDAQIANLKDRLAKLEVTVEEIKDAIKKLEDARPAAVKAEEDAKAAREAQKKADEEAQAAALQEVTALDDAALEAEIAAQKAKLDLYRKALAAKRQTVNA